MDCLHACRDRVFIMGNSVKVFSDLNIQKTKFSHPNFQNCFRQHFHSQNKFHNFSHSLEAKLLAQNFQQWSFLTVTTIGETYYWSGQLVRFIMCFLSSSFLSSRITSSCMVIGMRVHFDVLVGSVYEILNCHYDFSTVHMGYQFRELKYYVRELKRSRISLVDYS